jgi:hypothetical protein
MWELEQSEVSDPQPASSVDGPLDLRVGGSVFPIAGAPLDYFPRPSGFFFWKCEPSHEFLVNGSTTHL